MTEPTTADLAKQQLRDILDWAAILPALLARRAPTGDTSRTGRRVPGSRPPVRLDVLHVLDTRTRVAGDDAEDRAWHDRMASDHRQGLLPDLWQWCRLIEAEAMDACPDVPEELPERPVLASVVDWLVKHTPWALTQPWADEYAADVDWWWRKLREAVGEAAVARDVPCSRCREPLIRRVCPACLIIPAALFCCPPRRAFIARWLARFTGPYVRCRMPTVGLRRLPELAVS